LRRPIIGCQCEHESSGNACDIASTGFRCNTSEPAAAHELAWRRLIDEFGPLPRHISSTYRLGEAQATDAVATAWFKLVEHIGSLRDRCQWR
jgi:hypothetical protein